jgi:cytochrome bd ubiquinol oxidase subunit II
MTVVAAAELLAGVLVYAVFAGADFGAGFWDLTAGGLQRGQHLREHIDRSIGPVWEANHVWLIYALVVFWSAFPPAFAAVMTTLYLPLGLAALGIVVRGSGFAFRHALESGQTSQAGRFAGVAFAGSSIVTPFFFGTVIGAIASGRVPGRSLGSWLNPTSLLAGLLAVAVCAYLAAVFLTADARLIGDAGLERQCHRRAWAAAWATGVVTVAGVVVLALDAHRLFDRLFGPALPFTLLAVLGGVAALVLLRRVSPRIVRVVAAAAVAALILAWATAQYPYLLGDHTSIFAAAAPRPSLITLTVVFTAAAVLVAPSLVLLFTLQQRTYLHDEP